MGPGSCAGIAARHSWNSEACTLSVHAACACRAAPHYAGKVSTDPSLVCLDYNDFSESAPWRDTILTDETVRAIGDVQDSVVELALSSCLHGVF